MALSSRLLPVRAALSDRRKRLRHAIRHARPVPGNSDSIFNLDLHIAVIADVRTVLESRGLKLTDWSISGHTWVFGREREPVAVLNERSFLDFGPQMVRRFRRVYGSYLRPFRGFVATHTPCLSLLYRGFPGPTLAVCSTRYEWPFTFEAKRWAWLNDNLRGGVEDGWLHLVANNRADADYVENYLGIRPDYVPSACTYIAPTYSGRRQTVLVSAKNGDLAASVCRELTIDALPLRSALGKRYGWAELYEHSAVVLIPFNVSFMSLFEHYSACMPIYVPNRDFLKHLRSRYPKEVLFQLSYAQESGRRAQAPNGDALDLNDLRDEQIVDWYLDRADFYDDDWMPRIRQFESWAHLDHLLSTDDHHALSEQMAAEKAGRLARISRLWDGTEWLARVRRTEPATGEARI